MRTLPAVAALFCTALPAHAQFVARPYLDWRTTRTEHFDVHYPAQYAEWTRSVAARLESTRDAVGGIVGFVPRQRVQVLVDDPVNAPNGFAVPLLDRPTMVFFAVPPTPRQSIGNSRDWGEMLAVHEFAHLAHLARPARRPFEVGQLLPFPVSPIARKLPRWAIEGFATYVEGRVTGSGRPHNAQRAAVLRQWALEGRLPTYAQMSGSRTYNGGAFAYLVGSAYLEWLAAREGDTTITHLWRRMTARTSRDFTQAFTGVYGRSPQELHGRFNVEITRAALAVEEAIDSLGGVHDGELVQRLAWETGDPALSPDGSRVAVVLRSATRPGRVVIWDTGPDPVPPRVAAARDSARARARRRDPQDVPDRQFFPPPKRRVAVLEPRAGRAFDAPRFMPDGKRLLVTHWEPIGGGALRPDLYLWDPDADGVARITHGAAIRQADPEPGGRTAVAVQCTRGWCDLVRVDLASGDVTLLREGNPSVSHYKPRVSPDGERIVVAEQRGDRWGLLVLDAREPSRADQVLGQEPGNRFDAAWTEGGRALITVSDASGIANLERIDLATGVARPITRVTGAALGPDASRANGDVWFLSLHAGGLDVRRLTPPHEGVTLPARDTALSPVMPARPAVPPPPLSARQLPPEQEYGIGPRDTRWLPGISRDASGITGELLLINGDPVGRLELALVAALGEKTGWTGARGWITTRRWRPEITAELFAADQGARALDGIARDAVDATLAGGGARGSVRIERGAWHAGAAAGIAAMRVEGPATIGGRAGRATGWSALDASGGGRFLGATLSAGVRVQGDAGRHADVDIGHLNAGAAAGIDLPLLPPFTGAITHATLRNGAGVVPFERITVGGAAPVLVDGLVLPQRIAMPALPAGALVGRSATIVRASVGLAPLAPFYWAARVDGDPHGGWQRVAGLEARFATDAIPVVTLPRVDLSGGVGYSIDRPFKGQTTVYASIAFRP